MTQSGLRIIDRTVSETNTWLSQICDAMEHPDRQMGYHALRGVLFTLRDRLPVAEVFDLGSQLPTLIRGIYFEAYKPAGKPIKYDRDEFLQQVATELEEAGGANPEEATRAVLGTLAENIDEGEIAHLRDILPDNLLTLWPQATT